MISKEQKSLFLIKISPVFKNLILQKLPNVFFNLFDCSLKKYKIFILWQ